MITVLIPAIKFLPAANAGRLQLILNKHYKRLRIIELAVGDAQTAADVQAQLEALAELRESARAKARSFTGKHQSKHFDVLLHIKLVHDEARERLEKLEGAA